MKKSSIVSNLFLQGAYQILVLGVPLIVSPYLTRTLGSEELGIYTYSSSIAYYFVIFAMLGISRHGQRTIASASNDQTKLRKNFWSLYYVHVAFSLVSLIAYLLFVFLIKPDHAIVFYIQTVYVLSAMFDITWLFYGLECFKNVVVKNTVVKVLELILIFSLVRSEKDIILYTIIMCASMLVGQAIMIPQMIKIVKPINVTLDECIVHIKPLLVLSISVIAVSLYTVFDKTLLGLMADMSSVSYYEYANKIVGVPKSLLGVISTVIFPRVCKITERDDNNGLSFYFKTSLILTCFFGVGATFLLASVATTFAPLYYGEAFATSGTCMIYMAPVIIIVALGDLVRTQLMISKHRDKEFVFCVIANAIVNIILSVPLIGKIGIYGAIVGSVSAEICGLLLESWFCRKDFSIKDAIKTLLPFAAFGGLMMLAIYLISNQFGVSWKGLFLQAFLGGMVYVLLSLTYIWRKYPKLFGFLKKR